MAFGLIGSYIHSNGRIGVLVEVHCQNEITARTQQFKELVKDLAMQIAAYPCCEYIRSEDIPDEVIRQTRAIEIAKEDILQNSNPILEKIILGRVEKSLQRIILLEQLYIKDPSITVTDLLERNSVALGENIFIHRFVRFSLDSDSNSPPRGNPNAGQPPPSLPFRPDPLLSSAELNDSF